MRLKHLILIFGLFSFLASNGQETGMKESDLMLPRTTKEDFSSAEDYKHSIELTKECAVLMLNGKKKEIPYNLLSSTFKNHKEIITKKVLAIITSSEVSYQTVLDLLHLLAENNIKHYKLLSISKETL